MIKTEVHNSASPIEEPYTDVTKLKPFLTCKDHTVSRETFTLFHDEANDLLITFPRPGEKELPGYYESDEYISHTDSKRTFIDKIYQRVKNYSIKKKLKMINELSHQKGLILDIGCGTGDFLSACENDGWHIKGIEPNDKARHLAVKKVANDQSVLHSIKDLLSSQKNQFDVICMWHVLEHVPNLLEYIKDLKKLLKPEGTLVIAVPNYKSYDAVYYKEFWAAYDVPRHLWHFSKNSIKQIFDRIDFELIKTLPLIFDSFYVSLLSEKYKTGKTNPVNAFRIGLLSNIKAKRNKQYSSLIYLLKNTK